MEFLNENQFRAYPFRKTSAIQSLSNTAIVDCEIVIELQNYTSTIPVQLYEIEWDGVNVTIKFSYDGVDVAEFTIPGTAGVFTTWYDRQSFIVIGDIEELKTSVTSPSGEGYLLPTKVSFFKASVSTINIYSLNDSVGIADIPAGTRFPELIDLDTGVTLEDTIDFTQVDNWEIADSSNIDLGVIQNTNTLVLYGNVRECPDPNPSANMDIFFSVNGADAESIFIVSDTNSVVVDNVDLEIIRNPFSGSGDVICR